MTCGIYQFWCGPYFYVGRSVNIEQRWKKHHRELENGTHRNPWVQSAFNKHGWTGQDILVECEPHQNRDNEQHFIDVFYGTEFCMNISKSADGGGPAEHSEETKAKMSATAKVVHNLPEVRAKNSVGVKAACARPEVKAKRIEAQNRPGAKDKHRESVKRDWQRRKIRDFEAELADIPEGGDIISMFEVNHEEA